MSTRTPPPGKGVDIQADYTKDLDEFWFRWADQWWTLPHFKMLDFEIQLSVFDMQNFGGDSEQDIETLKDRVNSLFDLILGPEQAPEFRKVSRPLNFLLDTMHRWQEHSEITEAEQGESSASDGSSTSTGRPSRPTSNASTASGSGRRSAPRAKKTGTPQAKS